MLGLEMISCEALNPALRPGLSWFLSKAVENLVFFPLAVSLKCNFFGEHFPGCGPPTLSRDVADALAPLQMHPVEFTAGHYHSWRYICRNLCIYLPPNLSVDLKPTYLVKALRVIKDNSVLTGTPPRPLVARTSFAVQGNNVVPLNMAWGP